MIEIWKNVKGYVGLYQVSNYGRVRSLDTKQVRSNGRVMCEFTVKGQILNPYFTGRTTRNSKGYLTVNLKRKNKKVHRLVAEAFLENPNNYPMVNHKDGNTENNNVENLEWCTNLHNVRHAIKHGLKPSGENVYNHKLTQTQVNEIRNSYQKGVRGNGIKSLAKKYGVSDMTIRNILKNKKWRCINA